MGGQTYRFDPNNPSTTKFPAYYDGKNFAYEFGRGWIKTLTVAPDGALLDIEPFIDGFDFKQLISAEFGPDGSLYVLDYGTGFFSGDANSAALPDRLRAGHAQPDRGGHRPTGRPGRRR